MTRHARNCTAGSVYTYHEKKKDSQHSGYGSKDARLGKDSIKEFDCCSLTLQPCRYPVVTPEGFLYDKEAVLEYILHKKRDIARKLKEFEKQKKKKEKDVETATSKEAASKLKKFVENESNIVTMKDQPVAGSSASSGNDPKMSLPSFWVANLTPQAQASTVEKPDEKVRCPMSGKPLKLKDLIPVNFKEIKDGDKKKSLIVKDARYVCAVSNDVLGNSVPCAVLRPSGSVVTMECVERIIKKEMLDPINGAKLREKDIIQLQRGASSFSGAGIALTAKKDGPAMQA